MINTFDRKPRKWLNIWHETKGTLIMAWIFDRKLPPATHQTSFWHCTRPSTGQTRPASSSCVQLWSARSCLGHVLHNIHPAKLQTLKVSASSSCSYCCWILVSFEPWVLSCPYVFQTCPYVFQTLKANLLFLSRIVLRRLQKSVPLKFQSMATAPCPSPSSACAPSWGWCSSPARPRVSTTSSWRCSWGWLWGRCSRTPCCTSSPW